MSLPISSNMSRVRRESLRISSFEKLGWHEPAEGEIPNVGQRVYCCEGFAEVVKVLGRTSDGSRLLELCLPERPKVPFFAATSNILLADGPDASIGTASP